ncbi:hypothetical protein BPOR_0893g00010 [Botrytis porri]|uniref:Uncharacterized protein n=1 Tax=Botrytis porri TaxID=87229 RepID=A0A4Z1K880_9HELO|nr:hypothetical protein BPOR_0893g00010 [Botrytis porri]
MSSSDSKYCKRWIPEREAECGQEIPLSNEMCDECFRCRAAAYASLDLLFKKGGADNTTAPSRHEWQMPRNTKEISKTNSGPRALAEDPQPLSHRKMTNGDKRSSGR